MRLRSVFHPLAEVLFLAAAVAVQSQAQAAPAAPAVPSQQQQSPKPPAADAPAPASPAADALPDSPGTAEGIVVPPMPNGPTVVFDTSMGRMTCQFFAKEAPLTVANFIGLANGTKDFTDPVTHQKQHGVRFYDGTTFHRVIANFMIQGGDREGSGMGDPGYYIPDEFAPGLRFDREGRLAMANAGPGTGGSQFFITEAPVPDLTGKHTIFGQCDQHSILVVQSIARVEKTSTDKPLTPVVIQHVTIVPEGSPLPPDPHPSPAASTAPPQ